MTETTTIAINWNTIILALIGLASTVSAAVVPVLLARMTRKVDQVAATGEATHAAVNSERSAMQKELKEHNEEIRKLVEALATATEKERSATQQVVVDAARREPTPAPPTQITAAQPFPVVLVDPPAEKKPTAGG